MCGPTSAAPSMPGTIGNLQAANWLPPTYVIIAANPFLTIIFVPPVQHSINGLAVYLLDKFKLPQTSVNNITARFVTFEPKLVWPRASRCN